MTKSQFDKNHPYPDQLGIKSLYRFSKLDDKHPEFLSSLLVEGKLYHSTPDQFNDPFECKPHWQWPKSRSKVKEIKKHLIQGMRKKGIASKEAKKQVAEFMADKNKAAKIIMDSVCTTFSESRMCCFTTDKTNLLFWSHYADSHNGFCIEFDATKIPVRGAFKVKYQNEFPEVPYPPPPDKTMLSNVLIKSEDWAYEEEFRTVFVPHLDSQPENDGQSLILKGNEIPTRFANIWRLRTFSVKQYFEDHPKSNLGNVFELVSICYDDCTHNPCSCTTGLCVIA